ncbi:unnamed protein product [Sphagnum balticum]
MNVSKVAENGFCSTQTGTPYYTSPEIWKGEQYGSKCDIWSLGCLIYELCALRHPFKAADFPSLYRAVIKGGGSEPGGYYKVSESAKVPEFAIAQSQARGGEEEDG